MEGERFRRQEVAWVELFDDKFVDCLGLRWTCRLSKRPPRNKKNWIHYYMVRDDVVCECEVCDKQWGSAWGWVSFYYRVDMRERIGEVCLRVFGQYCDSKNHDGKHYSIPIWDQNEMEATLDELRDYIESGGVREPRQRIQMLPIPEPNFSQMPDSWEMLFAEMFADFSLPGNRHQWSLQQVDRDLKRERKRNGPYRIETDHGAIFTWFEMSKNNNVSHGKVFIRILRRRGRSPELWDLASIELVLYAIYQEVGRKFYNRTPMTGYPMLEFVRPFRRPAGSKSKNPAIEPESEEMMIKRIMTSGKHHQESCEACREQLCQKKDPSNPVRVLIRNGTYRPTGPN